MRGVRQLLSGECVQKEKKRCGITRIMVGAARSEQAAETQSTLGEIVVSLGGGNTPALWSLTQETPTTTRLRAQWRGFISSTPSKNKKSDLQHDSHQQLICFFDGIA